MPKPFVYSMMMAASLLYLTVPLRGQMEVTVGQTAEELLQMLLGPGVVASNVSSSNLEFTNSPGIYQAGKFTGGHSYLGFDSGIVLTSGNALDVLPPNNICSRTANSGNPSDPDLNALVAGSPGNSNACVIEFDFVPLYDTIRFRYIFGSEEYNEYVNSNYNDVFAFFITGPNPVSPSIPYFKTNIALIPNTSMPVSINNVNKDYAACNGGQPMCKGPGPGNNPEYYVDNCVWSSEVIQYDGHTVILTAWAVVVPCETYHLKIAIQDVFDSSLDSGVFLEAGSFSSPGLSLTTVYSTAGGAHEAVESCSYVDLLVSLPIAQPDTAWLIFDSITGTAINGTDCNLIPDSIFVPPGQLSAYIRVHPFYDGFVEPTEHLRLYYSSTSCSGTVVSFIEILFADWNPVDIGNDTTICQGNSVVFQAPEGYRSYLWHNGSTGRFYTTGITETVWVSVLDVYQCPASDTLELTVASLPVPTLIRHE